MSRVLRTVSAGLVAASMVCMMAYGDAVTSSQDYGSGLGIWNADQVANAPVTDLGGDVRSAIVGDVNASGYGYSYTDAAAILGGGASYSNVLGYDPAPLPQYGQKGGLESPAAVAYPGSDMQGVGEFPNSGTVFPAGVSLHEYSGQVLSLSQGMVSSPSGAQTSEDADYANPAFPSTNDLGRADSPVTIVPEPATLALVGIALAGWISSKLRHRLIRT